MSTATFKKTPLEKAELKKTKKDYFKNLRKLDSNITKRNSLFGFKDNDLTSLKTLLELAEKAKVAIAN